MRIGRLLTVRVSIAANRCQHRGGGWVGPQAKKFEQVSRYDHQISSRGMGIGRIREGVDVWKGEGVGVSHRLVERKLWVIVDCRLHCLNLEVAGRIAFDGLFNWSLIFYC